MERFVIGTGRCGSTLLCNMLAHHPEGLMISECLGAIDRANAFNPGIHTKEQLRELLLSNVPVIDVAVRRGQITKEQLYDVRDQVNFTIPAFLYITFPALTDDPQSLFEEMMQQVETFPDQTLGEHYLQIFSWLMRRFNKTFWFERSGSSIEYLPEMYRMFPDAKYLHIHRDGPDAIISMKNHFYFQMLVSFFAEPATREEFEQTELAGKPISMDDPISQRLFSRQPGIEKFAEYWNYQLQVGYSAIAQMETSQYKEVRFEDLLHSPVAVLEDIAEFLQMPPSEGWIDKAAAVVDANEVNSSIDNLPAGEQDRLLQACYPGQILLNRYRHPWIYSTLELFREMDASRRSAPDERL